MPQITSEMTFEGNNRTLRRAASAGDLRLLLVSGTGNLTVNDLTLRDGLLSGTTSTDYGAAIAIVSGGQAVVNRSVFRDNYAGLTGGAILAFGSTVTINDSVFSNNSTLYGTTTETAGGAIAIQSTSTGTIRDSVFRGNRSYQGGALSHLINSSLSVSGSLFLDNRASHAHGAVTVLETSSTTIKNSTFRGNRAATNGGALGASDHDLTLENSTFYGNRNTDEVTLGSAVFATSATLTLRHVTLVQNPTQVSALDVQNSSTLNMVNSVIAGSGGPDCSVSSDSSISTNINNWIEDGSCSAAYSGDPMLSTPRGRLGYIPPYIGSPLIDSAPDDANCLDS